MKAAALVLVALALSGCASLPADLPGTVAEIRAELGPPPQQT